MLSVVAGRRSYSVLYQAQHLRTKTPSQPRLPWSQPAECRGQSYAGRALRNICCAGCCYQTAILSRLYAYIGMIACFGYSKVVTGKEELKAAQIEAAKMARRWRDLRFGLGAVGRGWLP